MGERPLALGDYYPTSIPLGTMKILHALVGYLAVTALPFHPFAFASPLAAIDYDGYVNTTQNHIDGALMKHVLGNIVETCQTVTGTQNDKDSALIKHVPGDIIEARQVGVIVGVSLVLVVEIVVDVVVILGWISDNNQVRGNDVEFLIETFN